MYPSVPVYIVHALSGCRTPLQQHVTFVDVAASFHCQQLVNGSAKRYSTSSARKIPREKGTDTHLFVSPTLLVTRATKRVSRGHRSSARASPTVRRAAAAATAVVGGSRGGGPSVVRGRRLDVRQVHRGRRARREPIAHRCLEGDRLHAERAREDTTRTRDVLERGVLIDVSDALRTREGVRTHGGKGVEGRRLRGKRRELLCGVERHDELDFLQLCCSPTTERRRKKETIHDWSVWSSQVSRFLVSHCCS